MWSNFNLLQLTATAAACCAACATSASSAGPFWSWDPSQSGACFCSPAGSFNAFGDNMLCGTGERQRRFELCSAPERLAAGLAGWMCVLDVWLHGMRPHACLHPAGLPRHLPGRPLSPSAAPLTPCPQAAAAPHRRHPPAREFGPAKPRPQANRQCTHACWGVGNAMCSPNAHVTTQPCLCCPIVPAVQARRHPACRHCRRPQGVRSYPTSALPAHLLWAQLLAGCTHEPMPDKPSLCFAPPALARQLLAGRSAPPLPACSPPPDPCAGPTIQACKWSFSVQTQNVATPGECCALCSASSDGPLWTWGKTTGYCFCSPALSSYYDEYNYMCDTGERQRRFELCSAQSGWPQAWLAGCVGRMCGCMACAHMAVCIPLACLATHLAVHCRRLPPPSLLARSRLLPRTTVTPHPPVSLGPLNPGC